MRSLSFLITFFLLPLSFQCSAQDEAIPLPAVTTLAVDVDLTKIENNYINLSAYHGRKVHIGGRYEGDRIVLQNTSSMEIVFVDCYINSTHAEDALVFADEAVNNLTVDAAALQINGGGITFWGHLQSVLLMGGNISNGHTGIRATQDYAHRNIAVTGWTISDMTHEGIYLGVSQDTPSDNHEFHIFDNEISNTGWDAIQVGNVQGFSIYDNQITGAGGTNEYGQDYGITINPGSLGYVFENTITTTPKPIQILNSRVFFHAP